MHTATPIDDVLIQRMHEQQKKKNTPYLKRKKQDIEDRLTYDEYNSNIQQSFPIGFRDTVVLKRNKLFGDNRLFVNWSFRLFVFVFLLLFLPSS